jgi:hypothetical protein
METQKIFDVKQRQEVGPKKVQRRGKKPNPFLEKRRPYSKGGRKTVKEKSKQGGTRVSEQAPNLVKHVTEILFQSLVPPRPQIGLAPARRRLSKKSRAVDSARRRVGSEVKLNVKGSSA